MHKWKLLAAKADAALLQILQEKGGREMEQLESITCRNVGGPTGPSTCNGQDPPPSSADSVALTEQDLWILTVGARTRVCLRSKLRGPKKNCGTIIEDLDIDTATTIGTPKLKQQLVAGNDDVST
ncbi:UNVERIFIED_CONTAM: hypothetical protein Slati_4434300 [Sesamum latifolium]|uniref:Uncharacterized protein n=1 Tax=Sesamum latifolium TaxID=2727402 RepID=A0AAW2SSP4_9LAMI